MGRIISKLSLSAHQNCDWATFKSERLQRGSIPRQRQSRPWQLTGFSAP